MSGEACVIALAGRRPDPVGSPVERFPIENADAVETRLREFFRTVKADILVCSAAAGADLLALRVARKLGLRRVIVLPFAPDRFRETSVVDRSGGWGELFDAVIAEATGTNDLVVLDLEEGAEAYARVNELILDRALGLATAASGNRRGEAGDGEAMVCAVVVWEGEPRQGNDVTAAFARLAKRKGLPVETIFTTRDLT